MPHEMNENINDPSYPFGGQGALIDHLFRTESGRMIAALTGLLGFGQLPVIEDLVQDTLLQAMHTWQYKGVPGNPGGWLHRVARNKAIDYLRRKKKWEDISSRYLHLLQSEYTLATAVQDVFGEEEIRDSTVRMLFACCHPAIAVESQIAVSLKTLCGLSVAEIARAFFTSNETISKRIYRATEKLRSENIAFELPPPTALKARLQPVLHCLYLLFNEGYNSATGDQLIREDLCREAMRLAYQLTLHPATNMPQTNALLALFCFQSSRLKARTGAQGSIILLEQQDRSLWFRPLIAQGFKFLDQAGHPFEISAYHLEAAIASLHASASSFANTDWQSIYRLYDLLHHLQPGPVVALHKAIACGYAKGPEQALAALFAIEGLESYYLYFAAIAEMYALMKQQKEAILWYEKAIGLAYSPPEQDLMRNKIDALLLQ
jgi:RNA polymerase sigma factor (sigma-70 family)